MYSIKCHPNWSRSDGTSDGRPYLYIYTKSFISSDETRRNVLFERHRQEYIDSKPGFDIIEQAVGGTVGQGSNRRDDTIYWEYQWRPDSGGCVYHVVEHVFLAHAAAYEYVYIIAAGICKSEISTYARQRDDILSTFAENR